MAQSTERKTPTPNKVSAFFSVLLAARHHDGVAAPVHRGDMAPWH